jgi:cell wall-associated NlpC family hydrolase
MANRIILGAVLTMALTLLPSLAQTTLTKGVKKKSTSTKTHIKTARKSKSSKKAKGKRRAARRRETPAQAQMLPYAETASGSSSRSSGASVSETPPLMKVIPQRDGRFLLEPLSPKKPAGPTSASASQITTGKDSAPLPSRGYNRFEPWDFSDLVLAQARYYRDTPYARGGSLKTGDATDCSGFVQYIYQGFKIDLPRSSAEQAHVGRVVTQNMDFSKLLPGDLLFFRRGGRRIGHAGIYLGNGKMIHASNRRLGVTVTDLREPYYEATFVVAKRVFEVKYPQ